MSTQPPAADSKPAEPSASTEGRTFRRRVGARWKWIAGTILGAALVGIGGGVAERVLGGAETATRQVLQGAQAPLTVRVMRPGTYTSGHVYAPYYIVPEDHVSDPMSLPVAEMRNPQTFFDHGWAMQHGAVAGSEQVVRLELRGRSEDPITIGAVRAEVVERRPPVEGWYVASPGCGAEPIRIAAVDLDAAVPEVEYWDEHGPRKDLALSVTRSDVELIELHASTRTSMVDWRVQVFYSGPRGEGVLTLHDADGQPFRVSTETASDGYRPTFGGKAPGVIRVREWDANGITAC